MEEEEILEARGGIEPPIMVLQTIALPLGDRATGRKSCQFSVISHQSFAPKTRNPPASSFLAVGRKLFEAKLSFRRQASPRQKTHTHSTYNRCRTARSSRQKST